MNSALLRTLVSDTDSYLTSRPVMSCKNWVKYAMNALINIGGRNPALEQKAIAAAKRVGRVAASSHFLMPAGYDRLSSRVRRRSRE